MAHGIRDMIRDLGMQDRIMILGTETPRELIDIYQRCHLSVLVSVTASNGNEEGQGLVLREAQVSGKPVVPTRPNGFPENLIEGETGFLVPELDVDALAERTLSLIQNVTDWPRTGRADRSFVEATSGSKKLNQQLLGLYRGGVEEAGQARHE